MKKMIYSLVSAILLIGIVSTSTGCHVKIKKDSAFTTSTQNQTDEEDNDSTENKNEGFHIDLGNIGNMDSVQNNPGVEIANQLFPQIFGAFGKMILYPLIGVIVLIGIIFVSLIVFLVMRYMNKKAQYKLYEEAIKSGQNIPENFYLPKENANLESKGIKNIALGIGLGICFWVMVGYEIACIGIVFICVGIGQIFIHRSQKGTMSGNKKADE